MNSSPDPTPGHDWNELVARARADRPSAPRLDRVLQAVRSAARDFAPAIGWMDDFANIFGKRWALAFYLCSALTLAAITTWHVSEVLPALSWAEMSIDEQGDAQ